MKYQTFSQTISYAPDFTACRPTWHKFQPQGGENTTFTAQTFRWPSLEFCCRIFGHWPPLGKSPIPLPHHIIGVNAPYCPVRALFCLLTTPLRRHCSSYRSRFCVFILVNPRRGNFLLKLIFLGFYLCPVVLAR